MSMDSEKVARTATSAQGVSQSNRQNHCTHQRVSRKSFRDGYIVVRALKAMVNPTEDGNLLRTMATLQSL